MNPIIPPPNVLFNLSIITGLEEGKTLNSNLLKTAQKVTLYRIQKYNKFKLCGNKEETVKYIIRECSKSIQEKVRLSGEGDLLGIVQETEI